MSRRATNILVGVLWAFSIIVFIVALAGALSGCLTAPESPPECEGAAEVHDYEDGTRRCLYIEDSCYTWYEWREDGYEQSHTACDGPRG